MKFKKINLIYLFILSLVLTSCNRQKNWFLRTFPEDIYRFTDCADATSHVREAAIYERFRTRMLFSALWLNSVVRYYYVCLLSQRKEYNDCDKKLAMQKQLEELSNSVSFYILFPKPVPDNSSDICECTQAQISATLQVGDNIYRSTCIKKVDLEPEYIRILCIRNGYLEEKALKFRDPYLITFTNISNDSICESDTDNIQLSVSNGCYKVDFDWNTKKEFKKDCKSCI